MFSSKSALYSFIIISLLLFSSCSETTGPDYFSNGIIPLKISNSWNYILTSYDSSNAVLYEENQNSTIMKDSTFLNHTWYTFNDVPTGVWFTNKTDGYWGFAKANTGLYQNDTSILVYRFPTQVGDIIGPDDSPSEVVSIDTTITVPAGNFKAIHIIRRYYSSTNYLMDSFETFIAPHIGIIKVMQVGKKSDGTKFITFKKELVSYSLK